MEKLDELLEQLKNLPDGYISRKTIKGKVYSYLQYFSNGKLISKYVPKDKLSDLEDKLAQRKVIETQIKELCGAYVEMPPLTKREKEFTGSIMCGDQVAAKIFKGKIVSLNEKIAPLYLSRTRDIKRFFGSRVIDTNRKNSATLLRLLGIKESSDLYIPLYVNGCRMVDNYWFRPSGAITKYSELAFGSNLYSDVSLFGEKKNYPIAPSRTPDITTGGMFEKSWKLENNEWWLYKKENEDEIFSELFASKLAKLLKIDTVEYIKDGNCVKSKNFAEEYNFEPISSLFDNTDNYRAIYDMLRGINKEIGKGYLKLLYLDALIYNIDRRKHDFGILRNKNTGEIVSFAPNFDNNTSLIAILPRLDIAPDKDPLIKEFISFINGDKELRKVFKKIKMHKLSKDMISKIINSIDIEKDNPEEIRDFVFKRYTYIKKNI